MALLNRGGLTLVNKHFFEWGKIVLSLIRNAYGVNGMNRDPKMHSTNQKRKTWKTGVKQIISLRFVIVDHCVLSGHLRHMMCSSEETIHARFAVVFRLWKEANVKQNGQVAFHTKLKA